MAAKLKEMEQFAGDGKSSGASLGSKRSGSNAGAKGKAGSKM